jgi:kinetochore protein NDC80
MKLTVLEMQLEAGRAELATIEAAVAAQNLSADEVQRMNTERETLARHLEDYRQKIAEASQHSYDQEMAVTKLMDRFDMHLSEYTALAHSIGTILPISDAPGALGPGGVDYAVDVELGVEDVASVQAHSRRLRQEIWPALQAYGEGSRREMVDIQNQHIQLDDEHDRLAQRVERQKDEAANLEAKLSVANGQAEDSRAVSCPSTIGRTFRLAI